MPFPYVLLWARQRWVHDLADLNNPDTVSTGLRALPSELLLMIALQLPLSDAASFALVDRRLSVLIGPTSWPRLRKSAVATGHREQFLSTLALDIPSWFYCHSCSHLHPRDCVGPPGPLNRPSKPLLCRSTNPEAPLSDYMSLCRGLSFYSFTFHHLQLVMLRHYRGPGYGISTNELSFLQVDEFGEKLPRGKITTLLSVDARVCAQPARLCLRVQTWAVLHTRDQDLAFERSQRVSVCPHLMAKYGEIAQLIGSSLDEYSKRAQKPQGPNLRRCRSCKFSYQLQVLDTVSDGLAIVITKWLDLGSGLTPMDPKWRGFAAAFQVGHQESEQAGEAEKCMMDFEKEEGMVQQALTTRNASYLIDQRYKDTISDRYCGAWILQAGQRMHLYHRLETLFLSYWLEILFLFPALLWTICWAVIGWERHISGT